MCARFTLRKPPWPLAGTLGTKSVARTLRSRFNIAPTQPIVALINDADRSIEELRWGLVPPHAEHPSAVKLSTFNARIETIAKSADVPRCVSHPAAARSSPTAFMNGAPTPTAARRRSGSIAPTTSRSCLPASGTFGLRRRAMRRSPARRSSRNRPTRSWQRSTRACRPCSTPSARVNGSHPANATPSRCSRCSRRARRNGGRQILSRRASATHASMMPR